MENSNRYFAAKNLISLQYYFGIGTQRAFNFYKYLCSSNNLYNNISKKINTFDIPLKLKITDFNYDYADSIIKSCDENNIRLLLVSDKNYPERLLNISAPPLVIYYKGDFPDIDNIPVLCIVGPRNVSDFGAKAAYSLSFRFAKAGFTVVSGAAVGCDSSAHRGALKATGNTIAVLGCGLLENYLPENKKLREEIVDSCCLLSEYPPHFKASKFTFPVRNRIMSALSLGTIVVEGDENSGALVTANHALDQGRDVFVIPGNPTYRQYKGSNKLLRDGAIPLIDASDVFNVYLPQFAEKLDLQKAFDPVKRTDFATKKTNEKIIQKKSTEGLSNRTEIVYNYIDKQKFTADDLLGCGITDDEILIALTELEMKDLIVSMPGGMYRKL